MHYLFDAKGTDLGHYHRLSTAIQIARLRTAKSGGCHKVVDDDGTIVFEVDEKGERDAKMLGAMAAAELKRRMG